jgi:hypothetical protein
MLHIWIQVGSLYIIGRKLVSVPAGMNLSVRLPLVSYA